MTAARTRRAAIEFVGEIAAYVRISQDRRGKGEALVNQGDVISTKAIADSATINYWFNDTESATKDDRKRDGFTALIKAIEFGNVRIVYVWDNDRLVRTHDDLSILTKLAKKLKAEGQTLEIRQCVGSSLDLHTAQGIMIAEMQTTIAGFEGRHKAERQQLKFWARVDAGAPPQLSAFGYTDDNEIDRVTAPIVRELFDRAVAGESIRSLTRWINDTGARNSRGKKWDRFAVRNLLLNPRYIAKRALYNGPHQFEIVETKNPATWPALIDERLFAQVGAMITDPARKTTKQNVKKWLGAGLYYCECGGNLTTKYIGAYTTADGEYHPRRGYVCNSCRLSRSFADELDAMIEPLIEDHLETADLKAAIDESGSDDRLQQITIEMGELAADIEGMGVDLSGLRYGSPQYRGLNNAMAAKQAVYDALSTERGALTAQTLVGRIAHAEHPGREWQQLEMNVRQAICKELGIRVVLGRMRPGPMPRTAEKRRDLLAASFTFNVPQEAV